MTKHKRKFKGWCIVKSNRRVMMEYDGKIPLLFRSEYSANWEIKFIEGYDSESTVKRVTIVVEE